MSKTPGSKKIHMAAIATMKWTGTSGKGNLQMIKKLCIFY
jgi:hypothetical protein